VNAEDLREMRRQLSYAVHHRDRMAWARLRALLLRTQLDEAGRDLGVSSWRLIYREEGGGKLRLGDGVYLSRRTSIHLTSRDAVFEVGAGSYMNEHVTFWCQERITIGRGCLIGWDSQIMDSNYHTIVGTRTTAPVTLGDHVWVGAGSWILPGVTIGTGAVVAARSLVTADVAPRTLVGGHPAKVLRTDITWTDEDPEGVEPEWTMNMEPTQCD
jgi:acetyltransferase-like isoleucine patch superfamily enzyme